MGWKRGQAHFHPLDFCAGVLARTPDRRTAGELLMLDGMFTAEEKKNAVTRYHAMLDKARVMNTKGMTSEQISQKFQDDWVAQIKAEIAAKVERN